MKPQLIVITGPTASGKTAKAVALAKAIDAEIISADSRQIYRGMDLGTGKDLEEYNEELNPDVEVSKNIWCEQNVQHNGYEVQSEVDPYYAYSGDALFDYLAKIANERLTGDACKTTKVDVLLNSDGTVAWAYREDAIVVPKSIGGDTSGSEFDQMARLSELTGVPVPKNLASLQGKREWHTGVIDKDKMLEYVLNL